MAKPEWGTKRRCLSCGAAFYDLMKDPIVCPKCGTVHQPEQILKPRGGKRVEEKQKASPVGDDLDVATGDDDAVDDEMIEDASELGEDEDDMAEVIEGAEGGDDVEER